MSADAMNALYAGGMPRFEPELQGAMTKLADLVASPTCAKAERWATVFSGPQVLALWRAVLATTRADARPEVPLERCLGHDDDAPEDEDGVWLRPHCPACQGREITARSPELDDRHLGDWDEVKAGEPLGAVVWHFDDHENLGDLGSGGTWMACYGCGFEWQLPPQVTPEFDA